MTECSCYDCYDCKNIMKIEVSSGEFYYDKDFCKKNKKIIKNYVTCKDFDKLDNVLI